MAQQGLDKTILIILGLIVLIIIIFLYRPQIFDFFKQLPGYEEEEHEPIYQTEGEKDYVGGCELGKSQIGKIIEGKWIVVYKDNKEIRTSLYYKEPGIIAIYKGKFRGDNKIGEATKINSGIRQILISEKELDKKDIHGNLVYGEINNYALTVLQNSFLTINNMICKSTVTTFTCEFVDPNARLSELYKKRYEEYKSLFEKYSTENLPEGFDVNSFKSLLAAIAQKESSFGYPNDIKDDSYFTGYGSSRADAKKNNWLGVENQLRLTSTILKEAFENKNTKYRECFDYQKGEKMMCILSIYNTGKDYKNSEIGTTYAKDVISYYKKWQTYFCEGLAATQGKTTTGIFPLSFPTDYIGLSSCFGYRGYVGEDASLNHPGIDIPVPFGTDVKAAADGRVIKGYDKYSDFVLLYHGNGFFTRYVHVTGNNLKEGQLVKRGQIIAKVANKGYSPHLHFEVIFLHPNLITPAHLNNILPNKEMIAENSEVTDRQKAFFVFALPTASDILHWGSSEKFKDYVVLSYEIAWNTIKNSFKWLGDIFRKEKQENVQVTTLHLNPVCFFNQETMEKINKNYNSNSLACKLSTGGVFKGCYIYKSIPDIYNFFSGNYHY